MNVTEIDKAYAAGFFDGEGCIMNHKRKDRPNGHLRVTVGQNNVVPLIWLKARWGGWIEKDPRLISLYHRWVVEDNKARHFLNDVSPFCKVKSS